MARFLGFLGEYFSTIFFNWFGSLVLVVGILGVVEQFIEKKIFVSQWIKVTSLFVLLLIAQMFAYKELQEKFASIKDNNVSLEREIAVLKNQLVLPQSKGKQVREKLADFIREGRRIVKLSYDTIDPAHLPVELASSWYDKIIEYLKPNLDSSYVLRFTDGPFAGRFNAIASEKRRLEAERRGSDPTFWAINRHYFAKIMEQQVNILEQFIKEIRD